MTPGARYRPRLDLRRKLLLAGWTLASVVLVGRAVQLQLLDQARWEQMADAQHRMSTDVPAPRGAILDRDGVPLAVSREVYKVAVAPNEVRDRDAVRDLLQKTLNISASRAARAVDLDERWVVIPGVFDPGVREVLGGVHGVHLTRELRRDLPHGDLALGVIGRVIDGQGRGGIEQAFDSILQGRPGRQIVARDREGRPMPGQVFDVQQPLAGGEVTLTLDLDLQEIAQQALNEALDRTEAAAGDLLITDPQTGEILALASVREGRADALSALTTSYEPGSTLKPFTIAALLRTGLASLDDSIDIGNGSWRINGRVLNDVHGSGVMTLAQVLQESSNVGVAKAAVALDHGQQYENLRDFGFGLPTGLPLPGESSGFLRRPEQWSAQSPQSLAIGYEIAVTPIQMAMAYGALANGGRLMEARLVREVEHAGGKTEEWTPRVVRRVVDSSVTDQLREVLVEAVEEGTGTNAQLGAFSVAGKSGTARMYAASGGYEQGAYFSSFAGFFPAEDPQLVVFVKLERAKGAYYGGAVAAPVTRAAMEAAIASRRSPLNRSALLQAAQHRARARNEAERVEAEGQPLARSAAVGDESGQMARALGNQATSAGNRGRLDALATFTTGAMEEDAGAGDDADATATPALAPNVIPDLRGVAVRTAARKLHALGFRVALPNEGSGLGGYVTTSSPAPGTILTPGDTVRLQTSTRAPRGASRAGSPSRVRADHDGRLDR